MTARREFKLWAVKPVNEQECTTAQEGKSPRSIPTVFRDGSVSSRPAGAQPQQRKRAEAQAVAAAGVGRAAADGTGDSKESGRLLCEGTTVSFAFTLTESCPSELLCAVSNALGTLRLAEWLGLPKLHVHGHVPERRDRLDLAGGLILDGFNGAHGRRSLDAL